MAVRTLKPTGDIPWPKAPTITSTEKITEQFIDRTKGQYVWTITQKGAPVPRFPGLFREHRQDISAKHYTTYLTTAEKIGWVAAVCVILLVGGYAIWKLSG